MEYPDVSKLRVVDLKGLCNEYDLSTAGRKADLQQRLQEYFENNPLGETEAPAEDPSPAESPKQEEQENESEETEQPEKESPEDETVPEQNDSPEPTREESETEEEPARETIPVDEPVQAEPEPENADQVEVPHTGESAEMEEATTPPVSSQEPVVKGETMETDDVAQTETENMEVEGNTIDVKNEKDDAEKIASDKAEIAVEEKSSRRSRWGSRWTKEAPEVKIGKVLSAPVSAPQPVPKTDAEGNKLTKSQRKKLKKKRRKESKRGGDVTDSGIETSGAESESSQQTKNKKSSSTEKNLKIDIDYIAEEPELNPSTLQFKKVFDAFRAAQFMTDDRSNKPGYEGKSGDVDAMAMDADSEDEDKAGEATDKISKKKLKKQSRLTVAELKQIVERPDLVEMHDVTSMDPKLLVLLKSSRNTVAVPRHWSYKRKYLSGKRGIEKPPFELPDFIKKTGIMEMREALQQKEQEQSMKTKMRQRVRPKLGKIDIDYQKLHDAFFRYQTKPKMSRHGDIYYEGKEYETRLRELKPGELTDDLRTALGMPLGNNAQKVPPPWLIAMQRYGPPPSYPNLKIPGLNAPIPPGCSFGYHAGGWGKPPVDERGRPLYGDVFGVDAEDKFEAEKPSENLWGEMESDSDSSDDDSEEEESEEEGDQDGTGVPTLADPATIDNGLVTPSGLTSAPPVDTPKPGEIELRKAQPKAVDMSNPPPLYQVLSEKQVSVGKGMMGTSHVYDLKKSSGGGSGGAPRGEQTGNEVSLNPEDLELDPAQIAAKYQSKTQNSKEKEDMSDLMSEHLNKTSRDRKRKQTAKDSDQKSKKYKDFKF